MAEDHYDVGDRVELTATVTVDGVPTDPTTSTMKVKTPSGAVTTHPQGELEHVAAGVFRFGVSVTEHGTWQARFEGTGAAETAVEISFRVRRSKF